MILCLRRDGTPHNSLTGLWHNRLLFASSLLATCLVLASYDDCSTCFLVMLPSWKFWSDGFLHFFSCFLASVGECCGPWWMMTEAGPYCWSRAWQKKKKCPFDCSCFVWWKPVCEVSCQRLLPWFSDIKWLYCLIHFHKGRFILDFNKRSLILLGSLLQGDNLGEVLDSLAIAVWVSGTYLLLKSGSLELPS